MRNAGIALQAHIGGKQNKFWTWVARLIMVLLLYKHTEAAASSSISVMLRLKVQGPKVPQWILRAVLAHTLAIPSKATSNAIRFF